MKKAILFLLLCMLSLLLSPFSFLPVNASENIKFETIYPDDVLDYVDLSNISYFDICDKYICYTLDSTQVTLFEKSTRNFKTISGFNNITKLKMNDNLILVADNDACKIIQNLDSTPTIKTLTNIEYSNLSVIDFYFGDCIYIGTVNSNIFRLYNYNYDLTPTLNNELIYTSTNALFDSTYMLAINENNAYIVYSKSTSEPILTGLCIIDYTFNTTNVRDFIPNAKLIDTINFNNSNYLVTFTLENLCLLDAMNSPTTLDIINIRETKGFPILKVTDINYYNNQIIIADSYYKIIQAFDILCENSTTTLTSKSVILCSNNFDEGRFDNIHNIFIQGSSIYTSDTNNNRIHYIQNNKSYFINGNNITSPRAINIDSSNNMYFVSSDELGSTIYKYKYLENSYIFSNKYNTINTSRIGFISDICTSKSSDLFILDYYNNSILTLSNSGLKKLGTLSFALNEKSQISYLKALDRLIIFSNNTLYLIDMNGTILSTLNIENSRFITVDLENIYVATNNEIILINASQERLTSTDQKITNSNLSQISTIFFDIINNQFYGFDTIRQCLIKFTSNLSTSPFELQDLSDENYLKNNDIIKALKVSNNSPIYEYPYELGNLVALNDTTTNAIAIGEYDEYYEILINNDNTLKVAYVNKLQTELVSVEYTPTSVIATNLIVPIYKYPTLLPYKGNRLIVDNIPINTRITLNSMFPVSLDDKIFYIYCKGNDVGFVFNADIVLDETTSIRNLKTENATIKLIGKDNTELLQNDKETVIMNLDNETRIYVSSFDKNSKYTKVIYKDSNLNTYEGYILSSDIVMDKLDNSKIILIVVIIISITLLALIIIAYVRIIKKNK